MSDPDRVRFENQVDKLAQAYRRAAYASIDACKSAIRKQTEALQKQIAVLKVPGITERDVNLIVWQTISAETESIKKAVAVQLKFRVDANAGTMKANGLTLGGTLMDL